MRRVEVVVAGLALAVLAFGIALQPLLTPAFTSALTARYSEMSTTDSREPAETVRRFVTGSAPATELEMLMPADAVSHLADVRRVITAGQLFSAFLAAGVAIWIGVRVFGRNLETVAAALRLGAAVDVVLVALAGLLGLADFDALFARFHAIFFAPGTWVFPEDSLLIRLFPEQFWITAGVAWAMLVLVVAALYALGGWALARSAGVSEVDAAA